MTQTQFAAIIGTIYISHAISKQTSGIIGAIILIVSAAKELGWL